MAFSIQRSMGLISTSKSPATKVKPQLADDVIAAYPLTRNQEGIWIDYSADRSSTQYNLTVEWNLASSNETGSRRVKVLDIVTAIHEVTRRHAILRCTIGLLNGKPHVQEHSPNMAIPTIRLLGMPHEDMAEQQVHQGLDEAFDLENEYPVRWYIVQQSSCTQIYLVAHHIALDGGAMKHLSGELLHLLDGGKTCHVPPQPSERFSNACLVERAWTLTEEYKRAEATCLGQITGTHPFRWSKNQKRQRQQQHGPHEFRRIQTWAVFSKDDLQAWSTRYSTSWFRVSISLVGLLLHLDSNTGSLLDDQDHYLAVSFGGRPEGFQNTIGHFANALPVKVPVTQHLVAAAAQGSINHDENNGTLDSLIASVSCNVSRVKKAERLSLLHLARAQNGRKGQDEFRPPQVAVSCAPALEDDRCRLFPVQGSWDLFFVFQEGHGSGGGVELGVIYNPEIFNTEAMKRMQGTFADLVKLSNRHSPIFLTELPSMPKYLALPPASNRDGFIAVHEMFRMHAINNPDRIALSCAEKKHAITYGELDHASTLGACVLDSHGIAAESAVILHLNRGFCLLEWILAVLKAGGAFVYMDPNFPSDRKESILAIASGPRSVLVTEELPDRHGSHGQWAKAFTGPIVPHDSHTCRGISGSPLNQDEAATPKQVKSEDLAYIIFTSSSTGEPKGVMIEHGSLAHFVRSSVPVFRTGHGSCVLQLASFSFDASILEWSSALAAGGTLCLAEAPQALVGDYLADVIEQNSITFMQITPSALATIPPQRQLCSLRCISVGGEAVPANLLHMWRERVTIVNSIAVAFQKYTKGGPAIEHVSVGKPPEGTEINICDPSFTRVLRSGIEGEVCIGGKSLGRGYCQRRPSTETKFAVHPTLGTRLYRSGDRGMMLPDGSFVIRGRMDREIEIRGYRIAPEEVEKAIVEAEAAIRAVSIQVAPDGLSLMAVVTPEMASTELIRRRLAQILPSQMRPSKILPVPSLPLNASGKIDHNKISENLGFYLSHAKKTIPKKPLKSKNLPHHHVKEKTGRDSDVEKFISMAWKDEIGLLEIPGSQVNFFDSGGHSHLVPRLQKRITSMYPSCTISTLDLFHHSTIASQTKLLCKQLHQANENSTTEEDSDADLSVISNEDIPTEEEEDSIAVVGVAGKFPGADSPDELYANLRRGISGIRQSTTRRRAPKDCIWVPRAGTLSAMENFDANFWGLTREEAADMDPQQRLFLTVTLQALEDAGLDTFSHVHNDIGIFVGAAANQYHTVTEPVYGDPFQRANRGFVAPCISARTAYHLNLHGPNVTINTNCASSIVAMTLAVDALRNRRCQVAIVGGVSVQLFDGGYVTQPNKIFSATGHCRPFEEAADGTVPSDAVVSVVLKRTSDTVDNRDGAYALIAGAAYNSDGATNTAGYQVPSPLGQANCITAAWENARLSPQQLQYVELHGSGTPIGDALELEGLKTALANLGYARRECLVGSNKGSLGNTQHASGLVSLIKMCKSIQHGTIPAMVKTGNLNPLITDSDNLALRFAYQPTQVDPEAVMAISAAGWGGVNSHVVVKAPPVELLRKPSLKQSKHALCHETLAAPRKLALGGIAMTLPEDVNPALRLVVREASKILDDGYGIDAETDLRAAGLDSTAFIRLCRSIRNANNEFILPVSSFIQSPLTPSTLAARLETSCASGSPAWIQLQGGEPSCVQIIVLVPPSGGTCVALAALVSAIPGHVPVYGLEHPGHGDSANLEQQTSYLLPELAQEYANTVQSHLDTVHVNQVVFIGASFGGVVAMEMLQRLLSWSGSSVTNTKMRLVLLDAPVAGPSATADGNGIGNVAVVSNEATYTPSSLVSAASSNNLKSKVDMTAQLSTPSTYDTHETVHRTSIGSLGLYAGPDATSFAHVQVTYILARASEPSQASLERKKSWWTHIFPELRWEEWNCNHEELWRERAADVLDLIKS